MSKTKQTAVSWLIDQILKERNLTDLDIAAAKKIEKEQIIDAYKQGQQDSEPIRPTDAEQYYTQTYETNTSTPDTN